MKTFFINHQEEFLRSLITFIIVLVLKFIFTKAVRIFAVIGVALFAQWSILSNITAGVIIFFSYPFKIGNTIRIFDKEINKTDYNGDETYIIEDIRAFHLHLRRSNGEVLTYPNSLVLQKGVSLVQAYNDDSQEL